MENTLSGKPALLEFLRANETGEYTSDDTCSSLFHSFSFEFVRVSLALLSSTLLFVFACILLREERDVFLNFTTHLTDSPSLCISLCIIQGADVFARAKIEPLSSGLSFLDQHKSLKHSQVIEACGLGGSGKTELLIQTAVGAILPKTLHDIPFNGSEKGCILIDLDGKFDTLRFLEVLQARIKETLQIYHREGRAGAAAKEEQQQPENEITRESIFDDCHNVSLSRFRLIRCYSSIDLLKCLTIMEKDEKFMQFPSLSEHHVENSNRNNNSKNNNNNNNNTTPVRLVLVDNVAAFYWIDRASRRDKNAPFNLQNVHFSVGQKMLTVARKRRVTFLCTKTTTKLDPIGSRHKDFLPLPWSKCVTQRLLLDRRDSKNGIVSWDNPAERNSCGYSITPGGIRVD